MNFGFSKSGIGRFKFGMILPVALLIASVQSEAGFYPQENQCGSVDCFAIISGANLDNVSYFKKADESGSRVDFRDKTRPVKNFYFDGNVEDAKAVLATLISAKSSGFSVKVYVIGGDYQSDLPTRYKYVTLVE